MVDRTTKALLLAIAIGLWVSVAGQWLRPVVVQAQDDTYSRRTANAASAIADGLCLNSKIC